MITYSNIYHFFAPSISPLIGAQNPYDNYTDQTAHGNYQYISLEQIVDNFISEFTGDHLVLNNITRTNVIFWAKKSLQEFHMDVLKEIKGIELELGDTLDIVLPSDYLNYVRISWLNTVTGEYHPLSVNNNMNPFVEGWLQDHDAVPLFDADGYVLQGTSYTQTINDGLANLNIEGCTCENAICRCEVGCYERPLWNLDTAKNYNGTFNIDKRLGKIHFSSNCLSKAIILEYISDGLEYESESDIKINKMAELALYDRIYKYILRKQLNVPEYEKRESEKRAYVSMHNAKLKLGDFKIAQLAQIVKGRNQTIR